jgi:hypothetical protein
MHYALKNEHYPIETKDQIKTASIYFTKNLERFSPSDRVEIAFNMEKRAEDLKLDLNIPWIENYSRFMDKTASYSPEFEANMNLRKDMCNVYDVKIKIGDTMVKAAELIDKLISEKSQTEPLAMVAAINEFDKKAGLESHYDTRIRDSIFTVYGCENNPSFDMVKVAEYEGKPITDKMIKKASYNKLFINKVASIMGNSVSSKFQSSPIDTFNSFSPIEKQLFLEKMASAFLECEECGHREDISSEGPESEECVDCGGKMDERQE